MKRFIYSFLAMAALLFAATACVDEVYKPGEQVDGAQVYFPADVQTEYTIGEEVTSITIAVRRIDKTGSLTVPVLVDASALEDNSADLFTFPDAVVFKDGEDKAEYTVAFNRSELVDGTEYNFALLLNDEKNVTPYGNRIINLSVSPWPWEYMGTGKYRDDYYTAFYNAGNVEIDVEIHKHKSREGVYMVEEMYGWDFLTTFFGGSQAAIEAQYCTYTPTNIIINCSNPNQVYIPGQQTGIVDVDPEYGACLIGSPKDVYGTLVNGVITFPVKGLILQCNKGGYYSNTKGMFRILLPGAELTDYSLSATYTGMRVNPDNTVANAVLDFNYGADVTGISYVFVSGDVTADPSEAVKSIVDGTAENIYTVDNITVGGGSASIEAELEKGSYTIVAVPMDKTGAPVEAEAAATWFYFYGLGGSDVPECDMDVKTYNVSAYNPALTAQYPDHSALIYEITGSELKSLRIYLNKTAVVESIPAQGLTEEFVITEYGRDLSEDFVAQVNTNGSNANVSYGLDPETSYTILVLATNEYGKSVVKKAEVTTAQVPYTGELVVGNYSMSCTYQYEGETYTDATVLKLSPTADSEELFIVSNLMDGDGMSWFAKYDSAAKTLTLDGTSPDFQDQTKNMFGVSFKTSNTTGLAYFSYLDPEADANLPLVFGVNGNKELADLQTNMEVIAFNITDAGAVPYASVGYYVGQTTISHVAAGQNAKPATSVVKTFRKMSKAYISNVVNGNRMFSSAKTAKIERSSEKFTTLKVNTSVCEPLPFAERQIVRINK